ncbi:MAG: TonB-dependent receptor [Bacteroidota bacterium]
MTTNLANLFNKPFLFSGLLGLLICLPLFSYGSTNLNESRLSAALKVTITGTLTSADDGLPLIGASVYVKSNPSIGTTTDVDGKFSLDVEENSTLVFSYAGYLDQEVIVNSNTNLNIVMAVNVEQLEEVVVIGYGTQKKSHLTGSISKVENVKLDQIAVARVDDALIGQVSGVNIQATSAEAGAAPTITVRGFGSINASTGPAVVVDGLVVDSEFLGNLDMNDIASFEVLKDAASAAIYGSEGSNGVILITTKSGEAGETKFSYETFLGRKEAFGSDEYRKSVAGWADFELAQQGFLTNNTQYALQLVEETGVDRDWQDVFFDGGYISSHAFSARGGSDATKFSVSLRTLGDEGVVITDDYRLFAGNIKMDTRITDDLKFGFRITPSYSKRRALPTSVHNPIRQSPWLLIYHTEETIQYVDRDEYPNIQVGDYFNEDHLRNIDIDPNDEQGSSRPRTSGDMNPYAQYVEREHYEYKTNLLTSTYLSYKIADGLTAKTSLGVTIENRKRTRYDGVMHHASGAGRAQYNLQNRVRNRIISDNTISYNKNFGKHGLNVLVGATFQRRQVENSDISGSGFTNDLLKNLQGATIVSEFEEINFEKNKIGYFGRISYVFDERFLFNASFRRDASSVFGVNSKWGNFPAVSLGWNMHNEAFLEGSIVSRLKFRVSYGLTGNENFNVGDDIVNNYPFLALLSTNNAITGGTISPGVSPLSLVNPLLQWEASEEFNPGIDFGFANNRIQGSLDYYVRTSDQLLLENPVSFVTGFDAGIVNLGEVENEGWEFELRTRNITGKNLSWSTTLIASTNQNTLLSFGESDGQLTVDGWGRNSQWINSIGNPISSFYGYVVDRELSTQYYDSPFIPINGLSEDVIVRDLNGDGLISDEDKTILGDPYPDLIWSITNEFAFGNFDFSVMIQGSQGAQVKNVGDQYFFTHWQGSTTDVQQVVEDGIIPNASFLQERVHTNDIVQSANYFSLRNVNIGYNFTANQLRKFGLNSLRLYVSGQNLIYITSDEYNGFNPEFIDSNNTPISYGAQRAGTPLFRTFTAGLNVQF